MSTTLIERLETIIAAGEISRSGLARAAGLHPNSLRKLGSPDWNPTADTLTRLEKLIQQGTTEVLVGIEAIIDEARNGRMFILIDDENRENEGDLVIPAQMATPDAINFMARHGRGLICLALTKDRAEQLGLEPMTRTNRSRNETAFTVSIEARDGITTGISAADRARTIAVAIDAVARPGRDCLPGPRLPVDRASRRRPGPSRTHRSGRRRRAPRRPQSQRRHLRGDARRRDHGSSRGPDGLRPRARTEDRHHPRPHRLPAQEGSSRRAGRRALPSGRAAAQQWQAQVFRDKSSGEEQLALVHGTLDTDGPVLVRMHSLDLFADVLGERGPSLASSSPP